jgi:hypothetical protein
LKFYLLFHMACETAHCRSETTGLKQLFITIWKLTYSHMNLNLHTHKGILQSSTVISHIISSILLYYKPSDCQAYPQIYLREIPRRCAGYMQFHTNYQNTFLIWSSTNSWYIASEPVLSSKHWHVTSTDNTNFYCYSSKYQKVILYVACKG